MRSMLRAALFGASALAVVAAVSVGASANGKPEDSIKYRKAVFQVQKWHIGKLVAMAKGEAPFDAATAKTSAMTLQMASQIVGQGFGPGTDKGETDALPKIWTDMAGFQAAGKQFADAATALVPATDSLDNLKKAIGPVGASCKNCHDNFKKE